MASITSCCLCKFTCSEFECLYEANGERSEIYQVAVKYFSPALLESTSESVPKVICLNCWQHITDFHNFQQCILNAQPQQDDFKLVINGGTADLVDVKKDDILLSIFKCTECNEVFQTHAALDEHINHMHPVICPSENVNTKLSVECKKVDKTSPKSQNGKYENSFKCETCGASFSQYGNLRRHVRRKHAVQPLLKWICIYCKTMFRNRTNLEQHKDKVHNCNFNEKVDEEKHKMDCAPVEVEMYKESMILNTNENHSALNEMIPDESNASNDEHFVQTSYNTRFSKKEIHKDKNDKSISLKLPQTAKLSDTQISMPAIDIIDIKDEIFTDEESDQDTNEKTNSNYSVKLSSDTDKEYGEGLIKWKGYFQCPKCSQHIKDYTQLNKHFALEHTDERCYINCCQLTLYNQKNFEEHLKFHENPNEFKCPNCGKCFTNNKGLISHCAQVHKKKRSAYHLHLCYCKKAKKLYKKGLHEYNNIACCSRKKKILEDDAVFAKWKKILVCEICKDSFPYYSLMRVHFYRKHPGEKCYISCCERKISRVSDALQHMRFHLDPHAYRCKLCNLDFSGKNTLEKHMRNTHAGSLSKHKWACDECDKSFEIRQILTRHKNKVHSNQT